MVNEDNILIRKFIPEDTEAARAICCDTAYFGEPCEEFFPDRELLADMIMSYYTDFEPEHVWVAEYREEVIGYISTGFNQRKYNTTMLLKIIPGSLVRALIRGKLWTEKTSSMLIYTVKSFLTQESGLVHLDGKEFPAHMHLNIKKGFRGIGIGSRLLTNLLKEIKREGVAGIQCRPLRQKPRFPFLEKHGFQQFDCKRVKGLEGWLNKEPLYFMKYGIHCQDLRT